MPHISSPLRTLGLLVLLALATVAFGLFPATTASGQTEPKTTTVAVQPIEHTGGEPAILSATINDADGSVVGGVVLNFYVENDAFGPKLMKVGSATTDVTGTASLSFEPKWEGENKVTVIFPGNANYGGSQAESIFEAIGPIEGHVNAEFGIKTVRDWAPLVAFALVIAVWVTLLVVLFRTFRAMRQPRPATEAVPARSPRAGQPLPGDER